jgi:hypothetical protein
MSTVDLTKIVNTAFNQLVQSHTINSNVLFNALELVAKESFKLGEIETKIDTIFELSESASNRSL